MMNRRLWEAKSHAQGYATPRQTIPRCSLKYGLLKVWLLVPSGGEGSTRLAEANQSRGYRPCVEHREIQIECIGTKLEEQKTIDLVSNWKIQLHNW